jgi:hypothetical protein
VQTNISLVAKLKEVVNMSMYEQDRQQSSFENKNAIIDSLKSIKKTATELNEWGDMPPAEAELINENVDKIMKIINSYELY